MNEQTAKVESLAGALQNAARAANFGDCTVEGLRQLSGGASKETWAFDLKCADGCRPLILRSAPAEDRFESSGTVDLPTEAKLLQLAAHYRVPVPSVLFELFGEDGLSLGYVMDRIDGETVGRRIVRDQRFASARASMAHGCGELLARIHSVPLSELPALDAFSPREAVDALRERHEATGQMRPVFEIALNWLEDRLPEETPLTLVHGDFRNGNLIVGEEGVRAVLDWEMAHVGSPVEDLGWLCVNSWRFGAYEKPVGGFGHTEDLLKAYRAAGGRFVTQEELCFWEVYGTLRWGVICAGAAARFLQGARSLEGGMIARRASETEWDLMRLIAPREVAHAG